MQYAMCITCAHCLPLLSSIVIPLSPPFLSPLLSSPATTPPLLPSAALCCPLLPSATLCCPLQASKSSQVEKLARRGSYESPALSLSLSAGGAGSSGSFSVVSGGLSAAGSLTSEQVGGEGERGRGGGRHVMECRSA